MHNLFADWYRQVDLNVTADTLSARWKCVKAASDKVDKSSILELTRICFALPQPRDMKAADGAAVASIFKEADVTFPMKGNEHLLRVLFGATLAQHIEDARPLATFAALAIASAHCSNLVRPPPIEELVSIAERRLARAGDTRRSSALEDPIAVPNLGKVKVATLVAPEIVDTPTNHWAQVQQNFQRIGGWIAQVNSTLEGLATGLSDTRVNTTNAFKANADRAALERRIIVLKEECDVLWWLFGAFCTTTKRPWRGAGAVEMCLVLGRDLASLMTFAEPAPNAAAFLSKALEETKNAQKTATLRAILDGCPTEWRASVLRELRSAVALSGAVTPVHATLACANDSSRWTEAIGDITTLKADDSLSPLQWSRQTYIETLLLEEMEPAGE